MEGLIFGILRYMTESSLWPEGVLPIMAYTRKSPPARGTIFRPQVYERVGIARV